MHNTHTNVKALLSLILADAIYIWKYYIYILYKKEDKLKQLCEILILMA